MNSVYYKERDEKGDGWWVMVEHDRAELEPVCHTETKHYAELIRSLLTKHLMEN